MLLSASNSLLKLGVRPRAVTSPVRVHGQSGTWSKTSTRENLHPNLRPMPAQTANTLRAAKKGYYFSTVRIPGLRECTSVLVRCFVAGINADPPTSYSHSFAARRTTTEITSTAIWKQAGQSPSKPLIQGLVPASSSGMRRDQCLDSDSDPDSDQRGAASPKAEPLGLGPPPRKSARAIEERPSHGWPQAAPQPDSPLAHARRRAGRNVPPAHIETFPQNYRLSIVLPRPNGVQLDSEMITVSARRGGRLAIVADVWHLEHDCQYRFMSFVLF